MKKIIFILTLIITGICVANPEYYSSKRILSGEIQFQSKENKYISLEKEFLEISFNKGLQYDISYVFKNNSDKKQVIKTAFPIKASFVMRAWYQNKNAFGIVQMFDLPISYFLYYILSLKSKNLKVYLHGNPKTDDEEASYFFSLKHAKKLEDLAFNKYLSYKAFKRHFYDKALPSFKRKIDLINLNMFKNYKFYQNGKKLKINGVYLTFKIYKVRRGKYYVNKAVFTIRFLHKMVLKPKESIKIKVRYKARSFAHVEQDSVLVHENHYILGTGRTWKNNIKQLTVKTPYFLIPSLPKAFKKLKSSDNKHNYYLAKNYKPKKQAEIFIKFSTPLYFSSTNKFLISDGIFHFKNLKKGEPILSSMHHKNTFLLKKSDYNKLKHLYD